MNIQDITTMQKLATKAYDLFKKYAPEPDNEEDWESDEDSDSEGEDYD